MTTAPSPLPLHEARELRAIDTGWHQENSYRDTGCNLHPSCLSCRFEVCRYDRPRRGKRLTTTLREQQFRALLDAGLSLASAREQMHLSRRTFYRVMAALNREASS